VIGSWRKVSRPKYSLARIDMQAPINDMQDSINSLEECDKLNQGIKEDQRKENSYRTEAKDCNETRAKVHREEARETEKACRCGWSAPRSS
jgi:hypothetical protein